jgi:hypothetical protein
MNKDQTEVAASAASIDAGAGCFFFAILLFGLAYWIYIHGSWTPPCTYIYYFFDVNKILRPGFFMGNKLG